MNISLKIKVWPVLFAFMLFGCASGSDIVSTESEQGETYSADEVRRVTVEQPFLLSGDYFREKKQEKTIDLGSLLSKNESESSESEEAGVEKLRSSETQAKATSNSPPVPPRRFLPKVGFILDYESMTRETAKEILRSTPEAAGDSSVVVADHDQITEVLANTDCLEKKDLSCVSEAVGVYPGVRMLALIELFEVPGQMPGTARTRIEIVDTGLAVRYPLIEITAQTRTKTEANAFISQVLRNVFDFAVKKSDIMPWFCRSFSKEKQTWYISAGRMSGLKPGDTLRVVSGGKLVKNPAGLPAGWIPGKQKGTLKVDLLFGKDFASCSLTEGEGPDSDNDMLLP